MLRTRDLTRMAALIAAILLFETAFAEFEMSATLSGSLSNGDDSSIVATGQPAVTINYLGNGLALSSSWNTSFSNQSDEIWTGSWQADNQLQWAIPSRRLSGSLSYLHQTSDLNTDLEPSYIDTVNSVLTFSVPQTATLSHSFVGSATYQSNEDGQTNTTVDDITGTAGYSLGWASSPMQQWQTGISYTEFQSGAQIVASQLGWQLTGSKVSLAFSGSSNITLVNDVRTSVLVGSGSIQFPVLTDAMANVIASRSQTDALSFFDFTFIETPVIQQNQVVVDELQIELTDISIFSLVDLSASYLLGESRALFEIEEFSVQDSLQFDYSQLNTSLLLQPGEQSTLSFAYVLRKENDASREEISSNYGVNLNSDWVFSASISKALEDDSTINWSLSMGYEL